MRRRTGRVARWELVALAAIALGLFVVMVNSARVEKARDFAVKYEAARLCDQAFSAIREHRVRTGMILDEINDPNQTGLIGSQYSLTTVGRGDLGSVMTTTNPNFVAVVLTLLRAARLKRGDIVAVGLNGSLPALNIEVLAACKVLELRPIVISAVSSGMWGANDPTFTWLDMEQLLLNRGLLPFRSIAASLGGEGDNGRGISPTGRALLDSALIRRGVLAIVPKSLADAVQQRMTIYRQEAGTRRIRAFLNIGNAPVNIGESDRPVPTGIVHRRAEQLPDPSVARAMAAAGVTVINLSDINHLAYRFRFPVAPIPLPPLAKGRMFVEKRYPVGLVGVFTVIIVALLLVVIEIDLDYYLRQLLKLGKKAEVMRP